MENELLIPVSALQHVLFCERQFSLIHVEQIWSENRYTAEGKILHERVHVEHHESRCTTRQEFNYSIYSKVYNLIGICDLVEIQQDHKIPLSVTPVEFKRGHTKDSDVDLVQLCAQGICLSEMFGLDVRSGQIYYLQEHRRKTFIFDDSLFEKTISLIERCTELLVQNTTPQAQYNPKKCNTCSLFDACGPKSFGAGSKHVGKYILNQIKNLQSEVQS